MTHRFESFAGYCPKCDKKLAPDASFCQRCGHCLIANESSRTTIKTLSNTGIQQLFESTTNFYMAWLFAFSLLVASGIFYHFYHQSSFLIATSVIFFYCWIFLIAKLDELATSINKKSSVLVYAGLLLPVLGTIISYNKISSLIKEQS